MISLTSRLGFGLALSLAAALSAPAVVSAISHRGGENLPSHSLTAKATANWQTTPTQAIAAAAYQMSLSEDGQRLAALTDDNTSLKVWNTQTGALLTTATADAPNSSFSTVAISKDGTQVAAIRRTSPADEQLVVQAVEGGRILLNKPLDLPQLPPPKKGYITQSSAFDIVFSPDGKQVITQSAPGTRPTSDPIQSIIYNKLSFHDIKTGQVTQSIDLMGVDDKSPVGVMISPDGSLLASLSANYSDPAFWGVGVISRVTLWQRNQDNHFDYLTTLPMPKDGSAIFNVAFTSSNQLNLITSSLSAWRAGNPQTHLETWNPQTAKQVSSTVLPTENCVKPDGAVLSPDGTGYYSSYPDTGTCFGDVQTGAFQKLLDQPFAYKMVKFSGSGNRLAISNGQNSIQIFSKPQN